ncbi:MAG: Fic family protein [Syntrophales bacterium]|jgi:hypothetical protein|nr:Fic family protein [Syntrophales bacterium]MCK9527949.1 Fic family protein [Syntrophales bacterium]MDX9921876.1 Fic family protein [Syntrophales bacterium]
MMKRINVLKNTNEHPLVASCIFHYEFEFIHPFADGNDRMGSVAANLDSPALEAAPFVEFMLVRYTIPCAKLCRPTM